jgi:hypothetical protein
MQFAIFKPFRVDLRAILRANHTKELNLRSMRFRVRKGERV